MIRTMSSGCKILIAGVGNALCSDDGVGVHAVRELEKHPIPGVVIADLGTAVLHAMSYMEAADHVLVIDAARGGMPPGTIYRFAAAGGGGTPMMTSLHAMGLAEAARVLLLGKSLPPITVIGVEPKTLAYGMKLSDVVRMALPRVVLMAREFVTVCRSQHSMNPGPIHTECDENVIAGQTLEGLML